MHGTEKKHPHELSGGMRQRVSLVWDDVTSGVLCCDEALEIAECLAVLRHIAATLERGDFGPSAPLP